MSRHRHEVRKRAEGGKLSSEPKWNAGGTQNAAKEAEEKKRGGKVHAEGEKAKHRADKRARGGAAKHEYKRGGHVEHDGKAPEERAHGGEVHKHVKKHSMMHKGRARGGRIGSNLMPLSTAARVKHITPGETPEEGEEDLAKSKATIKG